MNVDQEHNGKEPNSASSSFHIIVNGRPRQVDEGVITYKQIVELAFPNDPNNEQFLFSVHYSAPRSPDGTLAEGQSTQLENGAKFDVSKTNRS